MMIANMISINQYKEIEENIFSKKCDLTLEINNIEKINELRNKYDAAKNKTIKIITLIIIVLALTFALAIKKRSSFYYSIDFCFNFCDHINR